MAALFEVSASGRIYGARRSGGATTVAGEAEPGSLIAVINIMGVVAHHASQVDNISGPGGTSTARVGQSFDAAMSDPAVKAIILHVDSPGGSVAGVQELADKIFAARGRKPIIAQVNSTAASAAYWIASQADEMVVTPSGQVGSIGVYGSHRDVSAAAEKQGLKVTFFAWPPQKVDGNQFAPPSAEFTDKAMTDVKTVYGQFAGTVARGRGVKRSEVEEGFGRGGVELAGNAVKLGMADRVATMEDTMRRVARMKAPTTGARAEAEPEMTRAEAGQDEAGRLAETVDEPAPPAEEPAPEPQPGGEDDEVARQAAAERDAFRRRRHAHRLRVG
ncbi:MAG: S49 family peptidase [Methylorubrum rhodinum]|uniref:S49 family peptidase n=1 Tax=Methylorubrum rhodinum TaxID=29428 RepID=UPI003BB1935D